MPNTLTGSAWAMAQWFQQPRQVPDGFASRDQLGTSFDGIGGLEAREAIANEASRFERFAVSGDTILLQTPAGRMILEIRTVQKAKLVIFTWAPNGRTTLWETWFNASSVQHLSEALRSAPEKRCDFDQLYINFKVR